ncbi:hypothetical protein Pst134EB_001653 [Puccinia striiformis f. sp. tritici]|nr:hypothetical protein Pst134EB_001653 [Puccinia striiformis f. sp. tritici]
MIEFLGIGSHVVLLTIQASLLQLVWRDHQYLDHPTVKWTRISLLPITLSLLFFNQYTLRYDPRIHTPFKVNLGCMFAGQFFKSILFAFNRPSSARIKKSRESEVQHESSVASLLVGGVELTINGSSNPSKSFKLVTEGSNHTIKSDLAFLMSTIRRMIILNVSGVLALYCWKGANDEALTSRYPILKQYEPEIMAVVWGVFIWTGIDVMGCVNRLSLFSLKSTHRLLSRFIPYQHMLSIDLSLVDLEQTCPFFFNKTPIEASSITDFWSRHWHNVLKNLFIEAGAIPLTSFVIWVFGTRKPHPKLIRLAGIIGAFTVSAILHEGGIWAAGPFDRRLRTSIFFLSQGLGVCLENGFKSLSGHRVGGFIGRIWTFSWLVFFGKPMITLWLENMAFDKLKIFDHVDQLGLWRVMFTPWMLLKLIFTNS